MSRPAGQEAVAVFAVGKATVGLVSHCPCDTDLVVGMSTYRLSGLRKGDKHLAITTGSGWLQGAAVERRSLAAELSLPCTRPVADG